MNRRGFVVVEQQRRASPPLPSRRSRRMRHPAQLGVTLRDGIVHLSGFITDERFRQAAIVTAANVSGVRPVHDHLYLRDAMSGLCFRSPEMTNGRRPAMALP